MSSPARRLEPGPPRATLRAILPAPAGRPRRGSVAFAVFSGLLLGLMVLGLVSLNVMVAQSSFHLDELADRADRLGHRVEDGRLEVARLSAPARIARESRRLGLHLPDPRDVIYVHAGEGQASEGTP